MTHQMTPARAAALAKCHAAVRAKAARSANQTVYLPAIPIPDNGWDQSSTFGDECFLCGRRNKSAAAMSQVVFSPQDAMLYDPRLLDVADVAERKELGCAFVGPDCVRKVPAGYLA